MAQRFGGKYSPGARGQGGNATEIRRDPRPTHPYESRTRWLTIAAVPFLIGAFFQPVTGMAADLVAFGAVALGAWLTNEGLKAQAAYDARRVARRPAFPRKLFGGVVTALGLGIGAWAPDAAIGAGLIAAMGFALHYLAFGADPMRDKGMEGVDRFQQDRVARVVAEGEAYLAGMADAIRRTNDRGLEARVNMFAETARGLFRRVEEDPGDLTAARRYLGVYLMGARDATVKFSDLYAATRDARAREDYETLLTDLEGNFAARTRSLIEGGRTDFDIEMQVLRDRLAREGVRTPEQPSAAELGAARLDEDVAEPTPAEQARALEDRRGDVLDGLIRDGLRSGPGARYDGSGNRRD